MSEDNRLDEVAEARAAYEASVTRLELATSAKYAADAELENARAEESNALYRYKLKLREAIPALFTWETLVSVLGETKPALAMLLKHATPRRVDAEAIVISFPPGSFYGKQAEAAEAKAAIAHVAERRLGACPRVDVTYATETTRKKVNR
jgi:hypothetical protein